MNLLQDKNACDGKCVDQAFINQNHFRIIILFDGM